MTHPSRLNTPESDLGEEWETTVQNTARAFPYPPTPDLARRIDEWWLAARAQRAAHLRRAWVALAVLVLLAALLAVPDVRASVLRILRIGAIEINLDNTSTLPPLVIPGAPGWALAGETTLEAARAAVDFPIRLPSYPPELGAPERVYLQDFSGPLVVLVWVDPHDPSRARLSLHILGPGVFAGKGAPDSVVQTTVGGQPALWTDGPYLLVYAPGREEMLSLVTGHVLLWEQDRLTYRLETDLSLEEARHIAESLR
jgi:hypothetical protein